MPKKTDFLQNIIHCIHRIVNNQFIFQNLQAMDSYVENDKFQIDEVCRFKVKIFNTQFISSSSVLEYSTYPYKKFIIIYFIASVIFSCSIQFQFLWVYIVLCVNFRKFLPTKTMIFTDDLT